MPVAIGAALLSVIAGAEVAATTFTVAGVSIQLAAIVGYGVTTLATIGAQFALNKLTHKRGQKGDPQIGQLTLRQATPVRTRIYGRVKAGGALFFEVALPVEHANLVLGIIICEGPIDAIEQYWLNDTYSTSIPGYNFALPWGGLIAHESRLGTDIQSVGAMFALYGFIGQLKGLAWTGIICVQPPIPVKQFQFYYPNGVPTIRVVVRGAQIYDPRDGTQSWTDPSTWHWSQNPALICMDYLTFGKVAADGHFVPRGLGLPKARINIASFTAFANMCDETVAVRYQYDDAGNVIEFAGTEPRYKCNGQYNMEETPTDVLSRILNTCDGHLYTLPDGTVGIRGGKWETPTVTLTNADIISANFTQGNEKYETVNQLKIELTVPAMDFQFVEGDPYDDVDNQDINGVLSDTLELPYVQSYSQAQRLAKIQMAKRNPNWKFNSLVCTLSALQALGEQFIHVTYSPGGVELIDENFLILNFRMALSNGIQVCELQLASLDSTAYDWDAATEELPGPTSGTSPAITGDPSGGGTIINSNPNSGT